MVLESAMDDWVSDYELQGDFQARLSLAKADAYRPMISQVIDWIRRGVLVPGDMLQDGLVPWSGTAEELAQRFATVAAAFNVLKLPGDICWFGVGPRAAVELANLDAE
jgi:hypothetical protein